MPYRQVRTIRLWGADWPITLLLEGTASAVVDAPLGAATTKPTQVRPPATTQPLSAANWRDQLFGSWTVWMDHPQHGRVHGYAFILNVNPLGADGADFLSMDFPDKLQQAWNGTRYSYEDGKILGRTGMGFDKPVFVEMALTSDRTALAGTWTHGGDPLGKIRFERLVPVVTRSRVSAGEGNDPAKKPSYKELLASRDGQGWMLATLELFGSDLPRNMIQSDPKGVGARSLPYDIYITDPSVGIRHIKDSVAGNYFNIWIWMNWDAKPGRKTIVIEGTPIEFDLEFEDMAAEPSELASLQLVNALEPDSHTVLLEPQMMVHALARYESNAGGSSRSPKLHVERHGRTIHRFADDAIKLDRDALNDDLYFGFIEYADLVSTSTTQPAARWTPENGDDLVLQLDGQFARLRIATAQPDGSKPFIMFSADADGLKQFGEFMTLDDGQVLQAMPVGQNFWITARYYKQQTDATKVLRFKYSGGVLEAEMKLLSPLTRVSQYRAGPFFIDPSSRPATTQPAATQPR
jgi:hypothetical protein